MGVPDSNEKSNSDSKTQQQQKKQQQKQQHSSSSNSSSSNNVDSDFRRCSALLIAVHACHLELVRVLCDAHVEGWPTLTTRLRPS